MQKTNPTFLVLWQANFTSYQDERKPKLLCNLNIQAKYLFLL